MGGAARTLRELDTRPTRSIKQRARGLIERALGATGAAETLGRAARRDVLILMYHSVADADDARWIDPANHVAPAVFERQMRRLARTRRVISVGELAACLCERRDPPPGAVVLTFDDGYRDNASIAAPVLRELKLPWTLYLPTGFVERREAPWIDQVYTVFRTRTRDALVLDRETISLQSPAACRAAYHAVTRVLLETSRDDRERRLAELREALRPQAEAPALTLGWDELREAAAQNPLLTLGVHTREHLDLTHAPPSAATEEVRRCVEDAAAALGYAPEHFAYPYNRASAETRQWLVDAGLRSAMASGAGGLIGHDADPLHLTRVAAPADMASFRYVISGARLRRGTT